MKKNKTLKRFLAFLLCAAMMVTYMPSSVYTLADVKTDEAVSEEQQAEETTTEPAEETPAEETAAEPVEEPQAEETATEPAEETATVGEPQEEPAGSGETSEAQSGEDQDGETGDKVDQDSDAEEEDATEVTEDGDEEEAYPAKHFEKTQDGITISVDAAEGAFPADAYMTIQSADMNQVIAAIGQNEGAKAVEIAFQDKDGKIDPAASGKVSVTVEADSLEEGKTYKLFHIDSNNTATEAALGESFTTDDTVFAVVGVEEKPLRKGPANEAKAEGTFTVTFVVDDNTFATANVSEGETIGEQMPADPQKDLYKFEGWIDEDGNEVTANTEVYNDITATAEFAKNFNTVTFYDRESHVHKTIDVKVGDPIGDQMPPAIPREYYTAYWAVGTIDDHGTTTITERIDSSYVPTEDTSVVPDYDQIKYTITFYEEDKETVVDTKEVTSDSSYSVDNMPTVPNKDGFSGKWVYKDGDFTNQVSVEGDTTVWAEYEQNVFNVEFIVNGEIYKTEKYYKNDKLKLPADPTVEGKEFVRWLYGDEEIVGDEPVTSNMTITSEFTDMYYVNFVVLSSDSGDEEDERLSQYFLNQGEAIGTMPQKPFVAGKVFDKWVKQGTDEEVTAETVVNESFTAVAKFHTVDVYTLTVNYYYLNGNNRVDFNTEIYNIDSEDFPYVVNAPSQTTVGNTPYYPSTPTLTVEKNEFNDEKKLTKEIEYVEYTAQYDFVYYLEGLNGGFYEEIGREHVYGVLNSTVTPTVKEFDYAIYDSNKPVTPTTITEVEGQVLPVYYTRRNFTLSYDSNGGSYVASRTVPYGTSVNLPLSNPTRQGYSFVGWYKDEALTEQVTGSVEIEKDTTLYAKWQGDEVNYTIVYMFEKYNDAGTESSFVYDNSETGTAEVGTTVHATDSDIPDKSKKGWELDVEQNANSSVEIAADESSVLLVYYKLTEYTFYFQPNVYYGNNNYNVTATLNGDTKTGNNNFRYTMTVKIGQDISSTWPTSVTDASFRAGNSTYRPDFSGWIPSGGDTVYVTKRLTVTDDMLPSSGTSQTYLAYWLIDSTEYAVNYWFENATDEEYTKSDTYSQRYNSSEGSTLQPKDITGYEKHNGNAGAPEGH